MEENVALDTSKQKQFVKSIKGIKKLLKKNEEEGSEKIFSLGTKDKKITKRKHKNRGLVYLSHIPHGFYEHEMTQYFKQFGVVTNVRVIRSRRTGNSKGYAFVEFSQPAVAEIVAETMNNYLMGKRLIKAVYIPPEKQRPSAMRKKWNSTYNPGREMTLKMKKAYNANKDQKGELNRVKKLLSNIKKTKKKLSEIGINYDFTPVDFPEAFKKPIIVKEEENKSEVKDEKKSKKKNKKQQENEDEEEKSKVDKGTVDVKKPNKEQNKKGKNESPQVVIVVNKKEQKQKEKKLKEAGVTFPENFIKINQEVDSDSSYEFDSDEYEKMLENEDELNSDLSGDDNDKDDDESGEESAHDEESDTESEVACPPKKAKSRPLPTIAKPAKEKKQNNPKGKQLPKASPKEIKRKVSERGAFSPEKQKFEKQSQKPIKKQFKKKK